MKKITREWVAKAEADFQAVRRLQLGNDRFHDQTCFFCQQSAEKYLKGILEEDGVPFARTHDLETLLPGLLPAHPRLHSLRRGLVFLTQFAVETRYPGKHATRRQAQAALRWAERVRKVCRLELEIA